MKFLIKTIVVLLVVVVGIPVALIAIASDGKAMDEIPVEAYAVDDDANDHLYRTLSEELDAVRDDVDADMVMRVEQDLINLSIFNTIRGNDDSPGINPDYNPGSNCESNDCAYIMEETVTVGGTNVTVRLAGIWVTFEEGLVEAHIAFETEIGTFYTFQSRVRTSVLVYDEDDGARYVLELDRIRLGSLPIPKGILGALLGVFADEGVETMLDGVMPFGRFESDDWRFVIDRDEAVRFARGEEADGLRQLVGETFGTILEERLLTFEVLEGEMRMTLVMSWLRNDPDTDIPTYLHTMRSAETLDESVFDYQGHLTTRFEQFVMTRALTGQSYFTITERTFNRIIYYEFDRFESARYEFEYSDGQGNPELLVMGLEAMWFVFLEDTEGPYAEIRALFDLGGVKSMMIIRADVNEASDTEDALILDLVSMTIGKEPGKTDYLAIDDVSALAAALRDLGDFEFGYVNDQDQLVIDTGSLSDMITQGTVSDRVTVTEVEMVKGGLRVHVETTDAQLDDILTAFGEGLESALSDPAVLDGLALVLDTDNEGPEQDVYNALNDIHNTLDAGGEVSEEDIQTLYESMDELDEATQDAVMAAIEGLIDPNQKDDFDDEFRD